MVVKSILSLMKNRIYSYLLFQDPHQKKWQNIEDYYNLEFVKE